MSSASRKRPLDTPHELPPVGLNAQYRIRKRLGSGNASSAALDIVDAIFTLNYLFSSGQTLSRCPDAADSNDDGQVNIADPIATLAHLFGGVVPHPLSGDCELDLSPDALPNCEESACS